MAKDKTAYDWYCAGHSLYLARKNKKAIQCFDRAIELDSERDLYWYSKGNSLYILDQFQEAIQSFNKAIDLNPDYVEAWSGTSGVRYCHQSQAPNSPCRFITQPPGREFCSYRLHGQ